MDKIEHQFCSVCFSLNLNANKLPEDLNNYCKSKKNLSKNSKKEELINVTEKTENKWPEVFNASWASRKNLLKESTKEEDEKKVEFENVTKLSEILRDFSKPLNLFKNGKLNKYLDILNHSRVENTIKQDDLDSFQDNYLASFWKIKSKVDKDLIGEIRLRLLDDTIDCCFAGHQEIVFKYPKLFYYLNGHFFEKIIYSMFFEPNGQIEKPMLMDKIVRDDGLMNECGYLVPNDLREIFKRIDSFKMPTNSIA